MKKKNNYKKTLNLPKINFPMRGNLNIKEPLIINKWKKNNIYSKIKENKKNKKKFILHDGPPYANGSIHMGHVYNKILKDIILKFYNFNNLNINYIPGWDCHGLPIELKIKNIYIKKKKNINDFKKECYKYALNQIKKQKKSFIRLGIFADWNNYYKTMDFETISNTILTLKKIIKLKLIKRKKKPTNWCLNCKSSLSYAEIEYLNKKSKSIYVLFEMIKKKFFIKKNKLSFKKYKNFKIEIIIWTTTPWTIPANCALSIHPKLKYSIIKTSNKIFIILKNKKNFLKKIKENISEIKSIYGKKIKKIKFYHPISKKKIPVVMDKKIKTDTGTGIVHIASEHGEEDYLISKKNNIKGINVINKKSKYIHYPYIKNIKNCSLKKAEKLILKKLKKNNKIIYKKNIIHKYPHCWRHKTPIILRTTSQWFIDLNKNNLRNNLLNSIKKVIWIPSWGYKKIKKMIKNRPDWCISRQRKWGTPITLFINKKTKKMHPKTIYFIKKISLKIKKYGPNYWFNINKKKFLGKEHKKYKKTLDVLDVWFDSGSTFFTVLNKNFKKNKYINLCIEGSDQYRGWFMSSLIISTAINKNAPYKNIISHGFVVDEKGKKMSKSLNNYIDPQKIINKYGADILRLWVSSTKFYKEIHISNEIILRTIESYRKIRNTIKFLVSNLNEFNYKKNIIKKKNILILDKWIIHKTKKTQKKIINLYKKFKFYKVIKKIIRFCTFYLSSLYLDIIKDRIYTIKKNTIPYLSAKTTIWMLLESILKWITPILPFTSEEVWNFLPRKKNIIYTETWFNKLFYIHKNNKINLNIWKKLIIIKKKINKKIENKKKIIKSSLETKIILYLEKKFFNKIKKIKSELKYFFLTSEIKFKKLNNKYKKNFFKVKCKKHKGIKCQRCWHYVYKINYNNKYPDICIRCINNILGKGEKRKFI